jgi:hypothetical protein
MHAFQAFCSALDGPDHVTLGHKVAGEFLDGERNLVGIPFLLDETKPVPSALIFC